MAQGNSFGEVFVKGKDTGQGSGNLGDKLNMEDPVGYVIIFNQIKDLSLIDIAGIGTGMENSVGINGKGGTVAFPGFRMTTDTCAA